MEKKRINIVAMIVFSVMFCCSVFAVEPRVIVYIWPGCGFCEQLMGDLTWCGIKFEIIDIMKPGNEAAREEMFKKSRSVGVPVLDFNGEIVAGYGPEQKTKVDNLITKYFPKVGADKLKIVFKKSQQYVNSIEAKIVLEKCFEVHKAKLICEFCLTPELTRMVEKGSFGSVPEQKMAVITVAKNTAINDYGRALGELRRVCSGNPAVREAKTAWDKAVNEYGFNSFRWSELFTASMKGNILLQTSYLPQSQRQSIAEFKAIKTEAKRILDGLFNLEELEKSADKKEEMNEMNDVNLIQ